MKTSESSAVESNEESRKETGTTGNWVRINERLLALERDGEMRDWKEWNRLVDQTKKIAGCIKRFKKHDKKNVRQAEGEVKEEEGLQLSDA